MKNNVLMVFVLIAVLIFSTITLAQGAGKPPTAPTAPTLPSAQNMGDDTQPLKERLEAFYDAKESYINQKRQCKENSVATNAPSGTCWNLLKPTMVGLLLKEVAFTGKRLVQLRDKNVTFPNHDEIAAKLAEAKAVFEDSSSSKYLLKSTAQNLENLINQIEETALQNQTEKLITQMDKLMVKADAITVRLDAKLSELRAAGNDVGELENSLSQYKAELAKTKENIASAKAKYAQINSTQEISQLAKEVRTFIDNANNYLVKAFDKARKIVPAMDKSEKGGNVESSDLAINETGGTS